MPELEFPPGAFGENLTTEGLGEETVHIGDRFRMGSAEFVVTQPRTPCFKLGIRFGRPDMVKRFLKSGRSGFYLAVLAEGDIAAGDAIERIGAGEGRISVGDINRLFTDDNVDRALLRRASELPALSGSWREYFHERLQGAPD
jgi:MOSC domain-containing protein YiiM